MKKLIGSLLLGFTLFFTINTVANAVDDITMPTINSNVSYDSVINTVESNPNGTDVLVYTNSGSAIIDMMSGATIRSISNSLYSTVGNDAGTYYVNSNYYYQLTVHDQFTSTEVKGLGGRVLGFLNNSNTVIMKGTVKRAATDSEDEDEDDNEWYSIWDLNSLIGYDVATKQVVFERTLPQYDDIVVGNEIAIRNGKVITIYDRNGDLKDILEFNSTVNDFIYTPDATKLIVATKDETLKVFNTTTYQEETKKPFLGSENVTNLVIDSTNSYLAFKDDSYFRLYDFTNGKRIYNEQDDNSSSGIALSKNAAYILIGSNVYSGKNLKQYIESISLDEKYKILELGQAYSPTINANKADGTGTIIKDKVQWLSDNTNIAYTDTARNEFIARNKGVFTLKVNYLDMSFQESVVVKDTKKPVFSGVKNIVTYSHKGISKMQGITANDLGEGDLTSKIKVSGNYNANKAGKYKLTYTVSDTTGNEQTATRTIEVKYNPSVNMFITNDGIYLPKSLYSKDSRPKFAQTVGLYNYVENGKVYTHISVEVKSSKEIKLKSLKVRANGKVKTLSLSGSEYSYYTRAYKYKQLSAENRNWFKNNINPSKTVTIEITTNKKTYKKTLTKTQKQALLDGALMYDYLKAMK